MQSVRCAKCGTERPLEGPCPKCLLGLGLESSGPAFEQLGPYRIVSRLGSGGMGEVYRASDPRLGRDVAIKVLPARLADDPERIARFRREARVAASLNHPNIAVIHGFEEIDEVHFLVMELVEGRSLTDRLRSGPMPIDEALRVVAQIAEGLEAAHEAGVVHRDLKPGNVMLAPDGKVKLLDFGLAKALDAEGPAPDLELSPTISRQYTTPGTVIGTVPYMSPEQARGRPVDRRTDIWSLGCVLYECLTGRRAFDGETATDVLAKVLERDPAWDALPARTPARVREIVERCLEKDPRRRYRDSGDVRIELERAREAREWTTSGAVHTPRTGARRMRELLPWGIAGLAIMAAVVAIAIAMTTAARSSRARDVGPRGGPGIPLRVDVTDPSVPAFRASDHASVAVTADGMTIAYFGSVPQANGMWEICMRRADEIGAVRCVSPPEPLSPIYDPFFSPDGKWLGFSGNGLYKISLAGGPPTLITENSSAGGTKGAAWTERGIVFSPAAKAGLMRVGDNGGAVETLTVPDAARGEVSHRWPCALPDGRHLLFTIKKEGITSFDQGEIGLLDLDTKTWKTLIRGGSFARYLPTGHIVYAREGAILAVPFDLRSEKVAGAPVTVLSKVMTEPGSGAAQFAVAAEAGALVFIPGGPDIQRNELVWLDRRGHVTPIGAPLEPYYSPFLSPDGSRVAATVFGATDTVVVYDFVHGASVRARTDGNSMMRSWYPDGRSLLVASDVEGGPSSRLYVTAADGTGAARRLEIDVDGVQSWLSRAAGGLGIVHRAEDGLYFTRLDMDRKPRRLTEFGEIAAARPWVSPDGRFIAYDAEVSDRREVYVRAFPTGDGRWQISHGGGFGARWSPRGDELVYLREAGGERWLVSVRVSATATGIVAAPPKDLLKVPDDLIEVNELASDGQRFLAVRRAPPQFAGDRVFEILNWFEQVQEKIPAP